MHNDSPFQTKDSTFERYFSGIDNKPKKNKTDMDFKVRVGAKRRSKQTS